GRVHVVWCESDHAAMNEAGTPGSGSGLNRFETLSYSMWNGDQWTPAHPVAPPQTPIVRNSIVADEYDVLHLLFLYSPSTGYDLYYRQAPASEGFSLGGWTAPRLINTRWNSFGNDIATYGDTVHIVYDDTGTMGRSCGSCSDVY